MTPWHVEVNGLSCSRHDTAAHPSVRRMSPDVKVPPEDRPVVERIKARRLELGLKQADLAQAIDADQSYVNKVENGKRPLQLPFIRAWAPLLNVSQSWLLTGTSGDALPLAHVVDSEARMTGPVVTTSLMPGGRTFAPKVESIAVARAGPGWIGAHVDSSHRLVAELETSQGRTSHELRPADILIFEPIDKQPLEGRVVWVTKASEVSEIRVWRIIDGKPWLWPFAQTQQLPTLSESWTVRAVLVEQRRRH